MFIKKFQKKSVMNNVITIKTKKKIIIFCQHIPGGGCLNRHPLLKSRRSLKIPRRDILEKAIYGIYKELTGLNMQGVFRILLSSPLAENVGFVSSL